MSKIGDLFVRLGLKYDEFKRGMQDAQRQTEQMTTKTESLGSRMKESWAGVAAKVAAVGVAIRGLARAFSTIADFEQANANLATILGKSVDQIKDMTDSALELGRTTQFTASQVTQLQTELAKLGFTTDQIKDMQKPVLDFSTAVGTDLASAAAFAGATLRAFGLSSGDTEDVLDTLAVSTNKSALSFSFLQTSMSIVAPVAKTFGFSLKDTTALLGTLANAGFDASSAATATRNILLNLANTNGKLAKSLGHNVTNIDELLDGLVELKEQGVDLNSTLAMTDKRSVAAFNTFLDGAEATRQLRGELEEVGGAAATIANDRLQTVSGSVQILKSAWEGFILSLSDSKGVVKQAIDQLTELVNALTGVFNKDVRMQNSAPYQALKQALDGGMSEQGVRDYAARMRASYNKGFHLDKKAYSEQIDYALADLFKPTSSSTSPVASSSGMAGGEGGGDDLAKILAEEKKKSDKEREEKERKAAQEWFEKSFTWQSIKAINDLAEDIDKEADDNMPDEIEMPAIKFKDMNTKALDTYIANLTAFEEEVRKVGEEFNEAIVQGFSDGIQTLTDGLMGLTEINAGTIFQALLEPLADLAIKQGEITMASGMATTAIAKSLKSLNGAAAIAAGAALIAVGAAAKSGLASLAASMGGSGASSATTANSSSASSVSSEEITIKVEGKISGSDILISGSRTAKNWNR